MRNLKIGLLLAALTLAGCATEAPEVAWAPRAGADLAADRAECHKAATDMNINQPSDYSLGRYGAAAAMASRLNEKQGRYGAEARMQDAVFEDCMTRKGWQKQ